jgi:hypothetical protein
VTHNSPLPLPRAQRCVAAGWHAFYPECALLIGRVLAIDANVVHSRLFELHPCVFGGAVAAYNVSSNLDGPGTLHENIGLSFVTWFY